MRKDNVFLVTTLETSAGSAQVPVQRVVCAASAEQASAYVQSHFAASQVVGLCSWANLEETILKLRASLACEPNALPVFIDANLRKSSCPT